jgi:hypothetical protein
MGEGPELVPDAVVTHYNGDGRSQRFVGEGGMQTVPPEFRGNAEQTRGGIASSRSTRTGR